MTSGVFDGGFNVVSELKLAGGVAFFHQFVEWPGSKMGALAVEKSFGVSWRLFLTLCTGVTDAGQTGAGNKTHITTTDDRYVHGKIPSAVKMMQNINVIR